MSFTPNDIRPAALEEGKTREIQRDIEWLAARVDRFIAVPCPACGHDQGAPAFDKYGFHFRDCPECRTVYMSPRATPEVMAEFYARSTNYEFWDKYVFPASRAVRRKKMFRPRAQRVLELCAEHGVDTDCLMDVGASAGMFCEEIRDTGRFSRIVAVEPNHAQAATCRRLGFETVEGDIARVQGFDGTVSVISSFEVIEHLFAPKSFLDTCRKMLVPKGILVVTCPNVLGFDLVTLGVDSLSFDVEHVNMFNPSSLVRVFSENGFRVLECSTPGELDAAIVRDAVLDGKLTLDGQPFLREVLINQWDKLGATFQNFLKTNGLSSHMWLAAVKN